MLHRDHTAPTALSLSSATNELQPFPVTNDVTCSQWLVKESSVSADRARCSLCMQHIGIVFADEWKSLSCVAKVTFNQMADELYMCIGSDYYFFAASSFSLFHNLPYSPFGHDEPPCTALTGFHPPFTLGGTKPLSLRCSNI